MLHKAIDPLARFLPDMGLLAPELMELAREHVESAVHGGIQHGAREVDITGSLDVTNPKVQEFINKYTIRLAGSVNDTTISAIRDVIGEGLANGDSYRTISQGVLEAMGCERDEAGKIIAGDGMEYRAEMIARTETDRASNAGRDLQLQEAGAVTARWMANPGACDICAEMDGTEVPVGSSFFKLGDTVSTTDENDNEVSMNLDYSDIDYPPIHPHCGCILSYSF